MNFDVFMVRDRVDRIVEWGKHLDELAMLPRSEFFQPRNLAAAESFLRRSLEAVLDIGRHVLARLGRIDLAQEYKAIAGGLAKEGIVDDQLGATLVEMAGYRNRLVHFYHEVSADELYEIVTHHRKDLTTCARLILQFVEKSA